MPATLNWIPPRGIVDGMKKILLLLAPLLLVAACAGGTQRFDDDHNDADVAFAQQMIPHHEQAVEMADLVDEADASPEVTALAAQIKAAQDPEITTMEGWLDDWDEQASDDDDDDDHMGMDMGDGMMSDDDMGMLGRLSGEDFDRSWLTMMVAHHEGAITMAEQEIEDGTFPAATDLARQIIAAQQQEIATMKGLLS